MSKVTIYSPSATAQIKHCAVDFDLRREPVPIHLVQYDKTLPILEVALYKGSVPYRLPEDAEANVRMGKRNNLIVYNPVLGCGENRDRVYIAITPQMTTQEGIFDPIVEVLVDGGLAGTSPMRLVVDRNPAQEDAIEDTSEVKTLVDLVRQASESAEQARQSASIADQSEAEAVKSAAEAKESAVKASKAAENAANSVAGIEEKVRQATASAQSAADSANTAAADAVRAEEAAERAEQIADFDPSQFATAAQGKLADSSVQSVNGIKPLDGNVQLELGSGSVQSVNAKGPDEEGNVQLTVQDLGAATAEQGGKADTAVQPADLEPYAKTAELPKKLPNPQAFGIRVGVSGDLVEYDGSAAKEISITPEAIGVDPSKFATADQGRLAQSAVQSVNGQPGPNPELTPAIIGAAAPANVLPNVLVAGLPGIRSLAYQEVDLLSVDASDPTGEINTPMFFGSDTPGTQLTSTPYTSGPFYGFRQVLMSKNQSGTIHLVTVLLFETYPIAGRVWGNTYDMGAKTWYGWKQNGAQAATLAYDEMAAAYNEGVASVGQ